MNDLQTLNQIVDESIKASSYKSVIIASAVFIIYTLIIKVTEYFKNKDKNKPIIAMTNAIKEISANVAKQNSVLDKFIQDTIKKDENKCKTVIELTFTRFRTNIEDNVRNIIIHNNIEANRELIYNNIHQSITTEYYKMISVLSGYEVYDCVVSSVLKEKWIEDVYDSIITIIFNGQSKENRLGQLSNKLQLIIENYITYMNNKVF